MVVLAVAAREAGDAAADPGLCRRRSLAMGLAALTTGSPFIIGGAILFMASDSLLAAERFLVSAISPSRSAMRLCRLGALLRRAAADHARLHPGVAGASGSQPGSASSKAAKSKPGATVQPTSVQSPRLRAVCQQSAGTTMLRPLARGEVGAERRLDDACASSMQATAPAARRHESARPRRRRGPGARPRRRRPRAGNRSRSNGRARRPDCRGRSRHTSRLPDAASCRASR